MKYEINLEDLIAKISLFKAIKKEELFVGDKKLDFKTAEEISNTYIFASNRGYQHDDADRELITYVQDYVLDNLF